jgi:hypothetical protein
MSNIEEGKLYMMQKVAESKDYSLFQDFKDNLEDFDNLLSLLLKYRRILPFGSVFYRARVIGAGTYNDLSVVEMKIMKAN